MTFDETKFDNRCGAYMRGIRNKQKRKYAELYWRFRRVAEGVMCPDDSGLSYMAAQAVRMHIEELWRDCASLD